MNDHDPPPLADPGSGAPPLLRDALSAARSQGPGPVQLARLAARLPLGAGPAPAVPADTGGAVAAGTAPSVLSGALIGAALGVLVSGVGLFLDAQREPPRPPLPAVVVVTPAPPPSRAAEGAPAVTVAPNAPTPSSSAATRPAPVAAPAAVVALEPTATGAEPTSVGLGEGLGVGMGGPGALPADPETETHLLTRAQDALGASPAQALALADEHAARFPGGGLGQEREVVAIQALLRLGRAPEARARGERFFAAFPGSAHRRRLEALLGR